jgi:hypothetical protein
MRAGTDSAAFFDGSRLKQKTLEPDATSDLTMIRKDIADVQGS